jgi:L-alanine-DL-glutamate epimerase-like enolase superfamily enzyme
MLRLEVSTERWPLKAPFRITGYTFTETEVIVVTLGRKGLAGRGEAAGVYYRDETAKRMTAQIDAVRADIERGIDREALRELLPAGGARNALDSALWDLEAKETGIACWQLAGLAPPGPLTTTYTVSAGTPSAMADRARSYAPAPRLKLKLTGEDDVERVRAVRESRPDAWIGVDANQGHTRQSLEDLLPDLHDLGVELVEQPVPIGTEQDLKGLRSPIPLAADESVQGLSDIDAALGIFDIINIKLDKCGGLTEALMMIAKVRLLGLKPMIGCMEGTALGLAPGFLAAQACELVDLDAALFLKRDRDPAVVYRDGVIMPPATGWGLPNYPGARAAASG